MLVCAMCHGAPLAIEGTIFILLASQSHTRGSYCGAGTHSRVVVRNYWDDALTTIQTQRRVCDTSEHVRLNVARDV